MLGSLADISATGAQVIASNGGFLIKPGIGLMIWTLIVFGVTMLLLSKLAFPRITEALDKRQQAIEDSIDTAERTREEADELLAEYRERLKEARAPGRRDRAARAPGGRDARTGGQEPRPGDDRRRQQAGRARHRGRRPSGRSRTSAARSPT